MRKAFHYIQYFFYLAFNWNIRIAWHIIQNEIRGEKKYRINTTGEDELGSLEKKGIDIEHSTIYMPASYDLLEKVFLEAKVSSFNHFIDIGCGKGRAMCVAAHFGVKNMSGIDLSTELCNDAEKNMAITKEQFPALNYKIINNDAFYFEIPEDADCIFLFNPFDSFIMRSVVDNIMESMEIQTRKMTIIYLNPLHKHLFTDEGFKEIFHMKKKNYLEASILVK